MSPKLLLCAIMSLSLLISCPGCSPNPSHGPGDTNDSTQSKDQAQDAVSDSIPDAAPDLELDNSDVGGNSDSTLDVEADIDEHQQLTLPVEPEPFPSESTLQDQTFIQEFNHTWNENEPEIGPLVAVVLPPAGYAGVETPLLVAPDGILLRNLDGLLAPVHPDSGAGPLTLAVATSSEVFVAVHDSIYAMDGSANWALVGTTPDSSPITRMFASGDVLDFVSDSGAGTVMPDHQFRWIGTLVPPSAVLRLQDQVITATSDTLSAFASGSADGLDVVISKTSQWSLSIDVGHPAAILHHRTIPASFDLVVVGSTGLVGVNDVDSNPKKVSHELFETGRVPLTGAQRAVPTPDGGFLVAASGGAYRVFSGDFGPEYKVYMPERWLPSPNVTDVLSAIQWNHDPDSSGKPENAVMWFATDKGLGWVTTTSWTVLDKTIPMVERILLRHDRDGAVADSRLTTPGDLSTNIPWDSDNDGGWSSYWLVSECLRFKVTGDSEAKAHFDKTLDRMLSLRTLSGADYFVARAVIRIDGCQLDDCDDPDDGEWFKSPDNEWWVKGNTSNDEVTSHMFMMGFAYDFCADESQKLLIEEHIDGIVGGLIDHEYRLVDPQDGEPTSYGQFDPTYINWWVEGQLADGARRSAQMLGALNLALHLTGDPRFLEAKTYLMTEHHYDDNIDNIADVEKYPFCAGNGDCDELGMQAFFALIRYESDPILRQRWIKAWSRLYTQLELQEDAFWNLINTYFTNQPPDHLLTMRWFHRYPTDLIRFPILNEPRQDSIAAPDYYLTKDPKANFRIRSDHHILPADERPNDRHNTCQFQFSGGWGSNVEMDSADVLFAYWLGRHYHYLD